MSLNNHFPLPGLYENVIQKAVLLGDCFSYIYLLPQIQKSILE